MLSNMQLEKITCTQFVPKTVDYINNIPEEKHSCPIVKQCLKKIIKNENYISHTINNHTLPSNQGNYLGDLIEIDIKGKTKDGDKENHIFVKHIVPDGGIVKVVNVERGYLNEVFVYSELQNVINELYEEACVPEGQRLRMVKSYDANNHVIILENLSRHGFKVLPRLDVMPLDFVQDSIQQLAKLHALSFALEYKRSEFFEQKIKTLEKPFYIYDKNGNLTDDWINVITTLVNKAVDHDINNVIVGKKQLLIEMFSKKLAKYYAGEINSVKCMCHGDFKLNNILFKKMADDVIETILIDYQLIFYSSPVQDIIYFMYLGTDRAFRKEHMEDVNDMYHKTLTKSLHDFNLDVNEVYPKDLFEKNFKDCLDFGLLCSATLLPMLLAEDPESFKKETTDETTNSTNVLLTTRLNEIFEEFIELGIL